MVTRGTSAMATFVAFALLFPRAGATAQSATVVPDSENFRVAPSAAVLASVRKGIELAPGERQGRWREVTLEGWIWAASVRKEARDGHDLAVSAAAGENLRASPNGPVAARLRPGAGLDHVKTSGPWIRVRRSGWIWEPSLQLAPAAPGGQVAAGAEPGPSAPPVRADTAASATASSADRGERGFVRVGRRSIAILADPTGDTLAAVRPRGTVEVLARQGQWARVRIEGWVPAAALAGDDTAASAMASAADRAALQADPDRFRGSLVQWTIQFIALQSAEAFRRDFVEGEPFILARLPGDDAGFVYVAVPPDRLDAAKKLEPLQQVRILARVRTASSALTGAPVLDLLEIRPGS